MIRRLFHIASVVGLVVSVTAWGVSYWGVFVHAALYDGTYSTSLCAGSLRASWRAASSVRLRTSFNYGLEALWLSQELYDQTHSDYRIEVASLRNPWRPAPNPRPSQSRWYPTVAGYRSGGKHFDVPLWISTLILTICSYPAFVAFRRRRRARHGYCAHCGYDLRGSPEGACSECGRE
jgi:hypothetical protein